MDEFTPEEREAAMRRIKALMAKTTQNGCSESEAISAAEAVSRLLNKYELNLTDIELKDSKTAHETIDTRLKTTIPMDNVVVAIAKLLDCKVWVVSGEGSFGGRMYHFLGLEHDVVVAKYIYSICDRAIVFSWEDHKRHIGFTALPQNQKGKIKDEFQIGMAHRLAGRLSEMKRHQQAENIASTGRDLVVVKGAIVEEEFNKLGLNLRSTGRGKQVRGSEHYAAGRAAGDRVNLNKGVSGGGSDQKFL
jgi:hypothetical protein